MGYREPERMIDLFEEYDVVVCGAGPAGIAAALSAGRQGLKTMLLEAGGCLGGVWTYGQLTLILDVVGKGGLMSEIKSHLQSDNAILHRKNKHNFLFDVEAMKALLEQLCSEAGVDILLHTRVAAAIKEGDRIQAVVVENSQGRTAVAGKLFIDCTGNGDFAAQANCSYLMGHPESGATQPASMLAIVSGVPEQFRYMPNYEDKRAFNEFLHTRGIRPSNTAPTIIELPWAGLFVLSVNHEFNVRCNDIAGVTQATIRARKEINAIVRALRDAGWSDLRLVSTPGHIALREGRRIAGLYNLTVDDIVSGRKFEDAVCTVRFSVDIHALSPDQTHGYGNNGILTQPYHIPYRSLVCAEVANLGLAGRCISGDFFAHASYRVTANSVATGEAIGYAASLAVASGSASFQDVPGEAVSAEMGRRGYLL
jgi:hypothetical protein